jgi:hypothetical protein
MLSNQIHAFVRDDYHIVAQVKFAAQLEQSYPLLPSNKIAPILSWLEALHQAPGYFLVTSVCPGWKPVNILPEMRVNLPFDNNGDALTTLGPAWDES